MSNYQTRLIAKTLLTVEIEPSLKEAAAKIAARNDETLSRLVRRLLREYVQANSQMELTDGRVRRVRSGKAAT